MKATRTVPGRPVNDADSVVDKVVSVIADSLSPSPYVDAAEVRTELEQFGSTLALLALGGHLGRGELVMISPGLRLQIDVPVGERALNATENITAARGAAKATTWTLYVPTPTLLTSAVIDAEKRLTHISTDAPPDEELASEGRSLAGSIDLGRLAAFGGMK